MERVKGKIRMKIGDKIRLGNERQIRHSGLPLSFINEYAEITDIYEKYVLFKIDGEGYWGAFFDDFTIVNGVNMLQKESLLEFLGC